MSVQGTIKTYNDKRGFGFIITGTTEKFFHFSDITDGVLPTAGLAVEFEIGTDRNGRDKAIKIKRASEVENADRT